MDVLGGEEIVVDKPAEVIAGGLPGYEKLSPAEQNAEMIRMFRRVFDTKEGRIVLGIILEDLHYFVQCTNPDAAALNNYAKILLQKRLGINKTMEIIDALMQQ